MRLSIALVTLFTAAGQAVAQSPDPRAERLLGGWIEAAGGAGLWQHVRTLEYTITTVWYDSAGTEVRRRPRHVHIQKLPAGFRVRVERTEAAGRYVQIWDGVRGFASLDGRSLADTAQARREVPYVAGELFYWMGLPWKLRDPGVHLTYIEPNTVHVRFDADVGLHDGDRYWYYWRAGSSGLPDRVEYIEQSKTENDRNRLLWSDWTRFGPAVYPAIRRLVDANGRVLRAFLIRDVRVNSAMPDSLFRLR